MSRLQIGLLFALLLLPVASVTAQGEDAQALTAAVAVAQCRSDFVVGVMQSAQANAPESAASLDQHIAKLPADVEQMRTMTTKEQLRDFVRETFEPDLRASIQALREVRASTRPAVRNGTRDANATRSAAAQYREDYQRLQTEHRNCTLGAHKQISGARVQAYTSILDGYQRRADRLKERGLDTTELDSVIAGARTEIVTPLQSAIDAATDGQSLQAALHSYCLFDNCRNGTNYHLEARYDIERAQLALDTASAQWNMTAEQSASAQGKIDAAQAALSSAGTAAYTEQQRATIRDNLKGALEELRAARPGGAQ